MARARWLALPVRQNMVRFCIYPVALLARKVGERRAIVSSAMKVAAMGANLDIPLGHINAAYVRSHFDAITVTIPDAPRADEIAFALAMATGSRTHSRMGGLEVWQVTGTDELR